MASLEPPRIAEQISIPSAMAIDNNLQVNASVQIGATPVQVWAALTDPQAIKQYLFGADTVTDWKVGSEILFQGDVAGQRWQDKGRILQVERNSLLKYTYWSGFCGLVDLPENYGTVTYSLKETGNGTALTVTQRGYVNEDSQQSSRKGWDNVLAQIKGLTEKSAGRTVPLQMGQPLRGDEERATMG